jgi:hypothetical protein
VKNEGEAITRVFSVRYSEEELRRIKEVSKALNKDISTPKYHLYGLEKVAPCILGTLSVLLLLLFWALDIQL